MLTTINCCLIIPTYNNDRTLHRVLEGVLQFGGPNNVIVIDDGSTDQTSEILKDYQERVILLRNSQNKGKGYSLRRGFQEAIHRGFDRAITIDSDGQHFPEDIPNFVKAAQQNPSAIIMGERDMTQGDVPGKSSFGNKFSSFWFWVHTGIKLKDTQTGFRLYPLRPLQKIKLYTRRFETEIEVLVKLAWKDIEFVSIPIGVKYDPEERVSHFRPFRDFSRISVLNTWFFIQTLLWFLPRRIYRNIASRGLWNTIRQEFRGKGETPFIKSVSIGFGLFMGIVPIWGFQLLVGMAAALALRLNKALFFVAANISIPPMIPLIIYASYRLGAPFYPDNALVIDKWTEITLESIHLHMMQYIIGAFILALMAGISGTFVAWLAIKMFRN